MSLAIVDFVDLSKLDRQVAFYPGLSEMDTGEFIDRRASSTIPRRGGEGGGTPINFG